MPDDVAELLDEQSADCRRRLIGAWQQARRQRLAAPLVDLGRVTMEAAASCCDEMTVGATWLLIHGAVAHNARAPRLVMALARRLAVDVRLPALAAAYSDEAVLGCFATAQLDRNVVLLPPALAKAEAVWLARCAERINNALTGLPPALWRAAELALLRPARLPGGLVIVRAPGAGTDLPHELVAATPPGAAAIDAPAEGLGHEQVLAELLALKPVTVAIDATAGEWQRLAVDLRAVWPKARLVGLGGGGDSFDEVAASRPYFAATGCPPGSGDPRPWPLAAYAATTADADIRVFAQDRQGRDLAADLLSWSGLVPSAGFRFEGAAPAQLVALAAALPLPAPLAWTTTIADGAVPLDLKALYRAGCAGVELLLERGPVRDAWAQAAAEARLRVL